MKDQFDRDQENQEREMIFVFRGLLIIIWTPLIVLAIGALLPCDWFEWIFHYQKVWCK